MTNLAGKEEGRGLTVRPGAPRTQAKKPWDPRGAVVVGKVLRSVQFFQRRKPGGRGAIVTW